MWNDKKQPKSCAPLCHFKIDFQQVDPNTGGKWLIHGTKHHKDIQLQNLDLACRVS